jgi:hypothetical protein
MTEKHRSISQNKLDRWQAAQPTHYTDIGLLNNNVGNVGKTTFANRENCTLLISELLQGNQISMHHEQPIIGYGARQA